MSGTYDKDIERLLERSNKAAELARRQKAAAEELVAKRYGRLGYAFACAIGANRNNIPTGAKKLDAMVATIVEPFLREHPEGWPPESASKASAPVSSTESAPAEEKASESVSEPIAKVSEPAPRAAAKPAAKPAPETVDEPETKDEFGFEPPW